MIFNSKLKEENRKLYDRIRELVDQRDKSEVKSILLKEQILELETNYLRLENLSISKRILELREESRKNNNTPTTIYLPDTKWDELRSEIKAADIFATTKDVVSIFGMRVKLTSKEMRVE